MDSEYEDNSKGNRRPMFSGRKEHYHKFRLQFKAYAISKGFEVALSPPLTGVPMHHQDTQTNGADDEDKIKYIKANAKAVSAYTLSVQGNQVFQLIAVATTTD